MVEERTKGGGMSLTLLTLTLMLAQAPALDGHVALIETANWEFNKCSTSLHAYPTGQPYVVVQCSLSPPNPGPLYRLITLSDEEAREARDRAKSADLFGGGYVGNGLGPEDSLYQTLEVSSNTPLGFLTATLRVTHNPTFKDGPRLKLVEFPANMRSRVVREELNRLRKREQR